MSSVSAVNSLLSSTPTTNSGVSVSSILAASTGATTPGIDVSAAVTAAIHAARAPERIWQAQQAALGRQTAALTAIQTATRALTADTTSLNTLSGPLAARTVTSSSPAAVTATAANGTMAGNHNVNVASLATTGSWYSDLAASATATLPASTFTITTRAGATATLTIGSGVDTLNDVAASINTQALGLTATVVNDSAGSRLALISSASGGAADFTITSGPTTTTSWSSPSVPSSSTTLAADTIRLTVSGATTAINVVAGETFTQLAADINSAALGVNASVVNDTRGYHLQIVSGDGTTPFTISEPAFGYSQAVAGADASLTVDGVPISSASNRVTGAIAGVTLNLLSPTPPSTPVNLAVASDSGKVTAAISQFVSDYNNAASLVNAQFDVSGTTQGALGADPTLRSLQNAMQQALSYVNQPASGTTTVRTISDLGISLDGQGALSIDDTTLSNALSNNASDVQTFFQGTSLNGFASAFNGQLSLFTNAGNGAFTVELNSISKSNADLAKHISDFEAIYIANQQTVLTAMYSKAEIALQSLPTQLAQIRAELGQTGNNS